jgi:hypothetical protein
MVADPDDAEQFVAEYSGRWVIGKVITTAASVGQPLTDWETRMLSTNLFTVTEADHPATVALMNKTVQIIRYAVAEDKQAGRPVVVFERGLTIPVEWDLHYRSIWAADTRLPWVINGVIQSAFLGNPVVGERGHWKHAGGRVASPAEVEAISDQIGLQISAAGEEERRGRHAAAELLRQVADGYEERAAAEQSERDRLTAEARHALRETQLLDQLRQDRTEHPTPGIVGRLLDDAGWPTATTTLIQWAEENLTDRFWVSAGLADQHPWRPQLLWVHGQDWIAFTATMHSWVVTSSVSGVDFPAADVGDPAHSPEHVIVNGLIEVIDTLSEAFAQDDDYSDLLAPEAVARVAQMSADVGRHTGDETLYVTADSLLDDAVDRFSP